MHVVIRLLYMQSLQEYGAIMLRLEFSVVDAHLGWRIVFFYFVHSRESPFDFSLCVFGYYYFLVFGTEKEISTYMKFISRLVMFRILIKLWIWEIFIAWKSVLIVSVVKRPIAIWLCFLKWPTLASLFSETDIVRQLRLIG